MKPVRLVECQCGCRGTFEAKRSNQKFLDSTHKERGRKLRSVVRRLSKDQAAFLDAHGKPWRANPAVVTTLPGSKVGRTSRGPQFLTSSEIAHLLRVTRWALWDWRRRQIGPPYVKFAHGTVRYPRRGLDDYMARHVKEAV